MQNTITVTGIVATTPRYVSTSEGVTILSFRLASIQRVFDRDGNAWVDSDTNWYTVTAFRRLADNAEASLEKGHRVIVSGKLKLREWRTDTSSGMTAEIEAETIGHDLNWGTADFKRINRARVEDDELQPA